MSPERQSFLVAVAQVVDRITRGGLLGQLIGGEVKVFLAMISFCDERTWAADGRLVCRPGFAAISERVDIHHANVRKGATRLQELGLIKLLSSGMGRAETNEYEIPVEAADAPAARQTAPPALELHPDSRQAEDMGVLYLAGESLREHLGKVAERISDRIKSDGVGHGIAQGLIRAERRMRQALAEVEALMADEEYRGG